MGNEEVCCQCGQPHFITRNICESCLTKLRQLKALVTEQQQLIDIYEYNCERSACTDDELPDDIKEAEQSIANLRQGLDL